MEDSVYIAIDLSLAVSPSLKAFGIPGRARLFDVYLKYITPEDMRMNKDNIVLIGMPGVGKSTVGVVLAKNMGYSFVDSDLLIQEQEGKLLHEIIEERGLAGFNEVENQVNASIDRKRAVIATGGSVVYGARAMEHLKEIGMIVYLSLPCADLEDRLGDLNERGVSIREGQTLADLMQERTPLYEKYADVIIDCEGRQIREIVKLIREAVSGNVSKEE